jgi:hypothetical protein
MGSHHTHLGGGEEKIISDLAVKQQMTDSHAASAKAQKNLTESAQQKFSPFRSQRAGSVNPASAGHSN